MKNLILCIMPDDICQHCHKVLKKKVHLSTNHIFEHIGVNGTEWVDFMLKHTGDFDYERIKNIIAWYRYCAFGDRYTRLLRLPTEFTFEGLERMKINGEN